jgi:ferredoxin-thioredoxin reductase catalytic subunit
MGRKSCLHFFFCCCVFSVSLLESECCWCSLFLPHDSADESPTWLGREDVDSVNAETTVIYQELKSNQT